MTASPIVDRIPQSISCSNASNHSQPLDISLSQRRPQHEDSMLTMEDVMQHQQQSQEYADPFLGWNHTMRRAGDPVATKANACWESFSVPKPPKTITSSSASSCSGLSGSKRLRSSPHIRHSKRLSSILKADLRLSSSDSPRRDSKGTSLKDFQPDIDKLLTSLQSTEFVGKIDPKYHSRYLSTPGF